MKNNIQQQVFSWLDTYNLTQREVENLDYPDSIFCEFEEEFEKEFEEEEVIDLLLKYQIYYKKKKLQI